MKKAFQHIVYKHMIDFHIFSHTEKKELGHEETSLAMELSLLE